jgi:hypothetical protein
MLQNTQSLCEKSLLNTLKSTVWMTECTVYFKGLILS